MKRAASWLWVWGLCLAPGCDDEGGAEQALELDVSVDAHRPPRDFVQVDVQALDAAPDDARPDALPDVGELEWDAAEDAATEAEVVDAELDLQVVDAEPIVDAARPLDARVIDAALPEPDAAPPEPLMRFPGPPAIGIHFAIPDLTYRAEPEHYDGNAPALPGLLLSFDTVMLVFAPRVTVGQANALLEREGAIIVGGLRGSALVSGVVILRLPTRSQFALGQRLAALDADPIVELVAPDVLLDLARVPPPNGEEPPDYAWSSPPEGANWGLEAMRAPQAWNFLPHLRRLARPSLVSVLDAGFARFHQDLPQALLLEPVQVHDHGAHVAGVIGAALEDGAGVVGVDPTAQLSLVSLRSVAEVMSLFGGPRLVQVAGREGLVIANLSLAYNWWRHGVDTSANQLRDRSARALAEAHGAFVVRLLRNLQERGVHTLLVAAAGNDSGRGRGPQDARWASPATAAALVHGAANIVVVEAITEALTRASFSNYGGHVSGPGVQIVSTLADGGYGPLDGTSMATPHVTGVLSLLYALDAELPRPTLEDNPALDRLLSFASATDRAAPLVDAWATLAGSPGGLDVVVDVDDGSADGVDRRLAADLRGDGRIDMADFRRFRDALLQLEEPQGLELDGPPGGPKRDLNGDGRVGDAEDEGRYPIFDFNGDGALSLFAAAPVPGLGVLTDLEVLQARFQDPWYPAETLPALLSSGDLEVQAADCVARQGAQALSVVLRFAGTDLPRQSRVVSAQSPGLVFTLPQVVVPYRAELAVLDAQGERLGVAELEFDLGLGGDERWTPSCGPHLTRSEVAGRRLRVEGRGFGEDLGALTVRLEGPDTLELAIVGAEVEESITALETALPEGLGGAGWKVVVEQEGALGVGRSNALAVELGAAGASRVAVGGGFVCVLRAGAVECTGDNTWGQLGAPIGRDLGPSRIEGVVDAVELAAGLDFACALSGAGEVLCWGRNQYGQLGDGTTGGEPCGPGGPRQCRAVAQAVLQVEGAVAIGAGHRHACAVLGDGRVRCWGHNAMAQVGAGEPGGPACGGECQPAPAPVELLGDARAVVAGAEHTCALRANGEVACWGRNFLGALARERAALACEARQLGAGPCPVAFCDAECRAPEAVCACLSLAAAPRAVPGLIGVDALSAGAGYTCARSQDQLECWGDNGEAQIDQPVDLGGEAHCEGEPCHPYAAEPWLVSVEGVQAVAAGADRRYHLVEGAVFRTSPQGLRLQEAVPGVIALAVSPLIEGQACALTDVGAVWCWPEPERPAVEVLP